MKTTMPYTTPSNGVHQQANDTIMVHIQFMLNYVGLPKNHWTIAVSAAIYHKNCTPTRSAASKAPYEA